MATEDEAIAGTQETLGKLISKPKMTEKYLKKPPFRFLHDIVMEVTRSTSFAQGLYSTEECDAAQLSDKAAKVEFLNKAIAVTSFSLGEPIDVSANKIVAGLEAEKTNIWLQLLHKAATGVPRAKVEEAVARVQSGETVAGSSKEKKKKREDKKEKEEPKEDKPKEAAKEGGEAVTDDPAAAAAEDDAKKKEEDRKRRAERKKREEEKKRKDEEKAAAEAAANAAGEDGGPEPVDDEAAAKAAEEMERKRKRDEERKKREEDKKRREDKKRKQEEEAAAKAAAEAAEAEARATAQAAEEAAQAEEEQKRAVAAAAAAAVANGGTEQFGDMPSAPGSAAQPTRPGFPGGEHDDMADHQGDNMDDLINRQNLRPERPRTAGRRPPKVVSKVQTSSEQPVTGPNVVAPAIITDGARDDDDEDLFEEEKPDAGFGGVLQAEDGQMHGKLVSNLLAQKKQEEEKERLKREEEETREAFEEDGGGIKMGKLKRKKGATEQQVEVDVLALGGSIQSLCQAANPLGKSIDLVHQDIANMGKELDHWKTEYRQASEQYHQQLKMTEEMLQPLYQKVTELDDKIAEQRAKIRNSRSRISKNDLKIQALLESVVCAK